MAQSVEYVNNDNFIRFADYTESDDASGHLPVMRIKDGQVVSSTDDLGFADTYTSIQRYADGAVHFYTLKNADGSRIQLVFEDPGSSPSAGDATIFGDNQMHGRLTDTLYVSASVLPDGGTPFSIGQHFSDGHLVKYALVTADHQADLTGSYDVDTQAATISLATVNGAVSTSGFGQIDALTKIDAAHLISQDGNNFVSDHGAAFTIVSDMGNGLISQDGNNWSVVSNDGGTITNLISQDGNNLDLLDPASIISQDGNGLSATVTGNIVAQGGLNIVAQGGLNLDDFNLATIAAEDTVELLNPGTGEISNASIDQLAVGDPATALGDFSAHIFNGVRSLKDLADTVVDLTVPAAFLDHTTTGDPYHFGDTLTVSWQVRNAGLGISGETTSQIYLSTDNTVSGDDKLIGSLVDPAIAGGTAIADNFNYQLPFDLAPGTYYIYTAVNAVDHADPKDNTMEDRTNNISDMLSFTVESASNVPDLTVPLVLLDKDSGHAGDVVNVSWQVKEDENVAAGGSTSKVYLSTDATIDLSDQLLVSLNDPNIAAGNALGDTIDITLPGNLAPGTYYIGVVADGDDQVAEADETNNTSAAQFTVTADDPTISLDPITGDDLVSRADLLAGATVTGTTSGVEDGRTVMLALEKADGTVLGTTTAIVQSGAFSVHLPSLDLPLNGPSGTLFVTASVTNTAGLSAEITPHVMAYDLTPPGVALINANVTLHDGSYSFDVLGSVGTSTGTTVHIFDGTTDLGQVGIDAQRHWTYGAYLTEETAQLSVEAIDAAGNVSALALLNASAIGGVSTGNGDDTLTGDAAANRLDGMNGNDQLAGGSGGDVLIGGKGEDSASYENALKGVTASLLKPRVNTNDAKGDTYSSIEDLRGSQYADTLVGDDKLNFFYGSSGADKFVFSKFNKGDNPDGIYDFHHAEHDRIVLDHKIFATLTKTSPAHPFDRDWFKDIGATGAKEDKSDRILYDSHNGELSYDRDGSGHKYHAVAVAYLTNLEHLSSTDFLVI